MMKSMNSVSIRRTVIAVATAIAIALPGIGAAGMFDRAKQGIKTVKTRTGIVITNVQKRKPLATALQNAKQNLPGSALIEQVRELKLVEQLQDMVALLNQMQADYQYFSGGERCGAECTTFRIELKGVFNEFLALVQEVPVLNTGSGLAEKIQRVSNLVDYIPPRALYLMWQTMADQIPQLRAAAGEIRQALAALPPMQDVAGNTVEAVASGARSAGSAVCAWSDSAVDKPFVELIQARLEMFAWQLKSAEGLIPDIEVKAEAGAEAGAAVANVTGAAGMGIKPTDSLKIALKVMALVPERINWSIKINMLRARTVCKVADIASR